MPENEEKPSLDSLGAKLEEAKKALSEERKEGDNNTGSALSFAMRVSVEMVAGLLVGAVIGYGLDRWLDTKPLFFLIGFLLGAIAGGMNIYRMAMRGVDNSGDK